jgi:hypothetical protein
VSGRSLPRRPPSKPALGARRRGCCCTKHRHCCLDPGGDPAPGRAAPESKACAALRAGSHASGVRKDSSFYLNPGNSASASTMDSIAEGAQEEGGGGN